MGFMTNGAEPEVEVEADRPFLLSSTSIAIGRSSSSSSSSLNGGRRYIGSVVNILGIRRLS